MIDWGDVLFKQLLLVLTSSQYLVSIISLYFVSKDLSILIHFSGVVYSMWSLMCDFFHLASCFQGPSVLQLVSAVHQYFMHFHSWVIVHCIYNMLGFPGGSDGKDSAYSAGDSGAVLGLGRSPGEGSGTQKNPDKSQLVTDAAQWQGALMLRCWVQFPKKGLDGATLTAQGAYSIFKDCLQNTWKMLFLLFL